RDRAKKKGRPKRKINPEVFEALAWAKCSVTDMAAYLGCCPMTITRLVRHEPYKSIWQGALAGGRAMLKAKQFEMAQRGNVRMLIWLGKQYLGQKNVPITRVTPEMIDEWIAMIECELACQNN
ncbi:MAG: hypothetical protein EB059_10990, partial [Alphaproteobacteria bacterium]|nr:hypothetical protein [Alphaproteobacteria bacterium]